MSSSYSPTPWMVVGNITEARLRKEYLIIQNRLKDAKNIAKLIPAIDIPDAELQANAERIVACVNACVGFSNEMLLDDGIRKLREDRDQLLDVLEAEKHASTVHRSTIAKISRQRDELLEALEMVAADDKVKNGSMPLNNKTMETVKAAIAKVKGGQG